MPVKDLHESPFDSTTIAKLEIFEDYAQAWLPTFVMQGREKLCIFDFFAGTGFDIDGIPGSPIRLLRKIKEQIENIFAKNVRIHLFLNEYEPNKRIQDKFHRLKDSCRQYLSENSELERAVTVSYYNLDFGELFNELLPIIRKCPSLVLLDQNGIKYLAEEYLLELEKSKETDFLYFVSTSYFLRFGNQPGFRKYFDLDIQEAKKSPYEFIHRHLISQIRHQLPIHSKLKLYPFTLKKGSNIHGIIFGATHMRAVDKFLGISWKKNELNGEANFDIDNDEGKIQLELLEPKLTKIEAFKRTVRDKILSKEISNNIELYKFTMEEGHIGKHSADTLRDMKRNKEVDYDCQSPLVTYEKAYKKVKKLEYRV